MKSRDQFRAAVLVHAATQARDWIERAEERARGELAERDDHLRLDDFDLPEQERLAGLDFVLLGVPVLWRTTLDHIRNVDVIAREADRLDDFREELTGAADERDALDVFVMARRLADKHEVGRRIAHSEHDLLPPEAVQLAARAVAKVGADG